MMLEVVFHLVRLKLMAGVLLEVVKELSLMVKGYLLLLLLCWLVLKFDLLVFLGFAELGLDREVVPELDGMVGSVDQVELLLEL